MLKKLSSGLVIMSIVLLVISGVVLTALLFLYDLTAKLSGIPAILFTSINLLVLLIMIPYGKSVSARGSFAASVQIWSITILYSVVQFVTLFLTADVWGNVAYTLFQLIVLTLWFGIVGAITAMGKHNYCKEDHIQ